MAASQCILTTDVISGPLQMQNEFAQAAMVACVRAIGYIPLVYTDSDRNRCVFSGRFLFFCCCRYVVRLI